MIAAGRTVEYVVGAWRLFNLKSVCTGFDFERHDGRWLACGSFGWMRCRCSFAIGALSIDRKCDAIALLSSVSMSLQSCVSLILSVKPTRPRCPRKPRSPATRTLYTMLGMVHLARGLMAPMEDRIPLRRVIASLQARVIIDKVLVVGLSSMEMHCMPLGTYTATGDVRDFSRNMIHTNRPRLVSSCSPSFIDSLHH